jgi:hypothetical protein
MSPGGVVAIWDMVQPSRGARVDLGAEAAALMFRVTSNSRVCTAEEYSSWLSQSGFQRVQVYWPPRVPVQVLVVAHA